MPTIKHATKHRSSQNAIFIGMALAWLVLLQFVFPLIDHTALRWSVGVIVCIAWLWAVLTMMTSRDRAFTCPDCGGPVQRPVDARTEEGSPILKLCPACDVLWHMGTAPD